MANYKLLSKCLLILTVFISSHVFSDPETVYTKPYRYGSFVAHVGAYKGHAGKEQHINIQGLVGSDFSVTDHGNVNWLAGLGYFFNVDRNEYVRVDFGLDAFYLAKTQVKGKVTQESAFTNLSYEYSVKHLPIYGAVKTLFYTGSPYVNFVLDVGAGVNFLRAYNFNEKSLNGTTIPDNFFSSKTKTNFSASAGLGIRINNFFRRLPLECGYRFFYLGKGELTTTTEQVLNNLHTGNTYANAAVCSILL